MTDLVLLVGHRGTGKSQLLRRCREYLPEHEGFDLDQEIERKSDLSISEIFEIQGEERFRAIERETLDELLARPGKKIIALGAGYTGELPSTALVVWVRRESDKQGRVFLNRPRLNADVSPLQEYLQRFPERQENYQNISNLILTLGEGVEPHEKRFFTRDWKKSGCFTLFSRHIKNLEYLDAIPAEFFELRDDLLTKKEIQQVLKQMDHKSLLFSHRQNPLEASVVESIPSSVTLRDWPIEAGTCPDRARWPILSCHSVAHLEGFFQQCDHHAYAKLALPIETAAGLMEFEQWRNLDPARRSFLPMSPSGQWSWYRLRNRNENFLQFFSDGIGSAPDQPSLLEWISGTHNGQKFAAILGDPVAYSLTPSAQREFFAKRGMAVYRISQAQETWSMDLRALMQLGLSAAAVTSPLKTLAFESCTKRFSDLESTNTIFVEKGQILGTNTDVHALEEWLSGLENVAVWGGGGILPALKRVLPEATYFSARTGKLKSGPGDGVFHHLIWACGNSPSYQLPPSDWPLEKVWDLSYVDWSMGRELSLARNYDYESGEKMFYIQAAKQREFWRSCYGRGE